MAEPITLQFTGHVTHGGGELEAFFPIDSSFTWTLTYESDFPASVDGVHAFPTEATTDQLQWVATGSGGSYTRAMDRPHQTWIHVRPEDAEIFFDTSISGRAVTGTILTTPTRTLYPIAFDSWFSFPGQTFDSFALPRALPDAPMVGGFHMMYATDPGCGCSMDSFSGTWTHVEQVRVPEPATALLAGLGLLGAVYSRVRRRRDH